MLCLAGGWAIAIAPATRADIPITGGTARGSAAFFNKATSSQSTGSTTSSNSSSNAAPVLFDAVVRQLQLVTPNGTTSTARFRALAGGFSQGTSSNSNDPYTGGTILLQGGLSGVAFSQTGQPVFFQNVPTNLRFTLNSYNPSTFLGGSLISPNQGVSSPLIFLPIQNVTLSSDSASKFTANTGTLSVGSFDAKVTGDSISLPGNLQLSDASSSAQISNDSVGAVTKFLLQSQGNTTGYLTANSGQITFSTTALNNNSSTGTTTGNTGSTGTTTSSTSNDGTATISFQIQSTDSQSGQQTNISGTTTNSGAQINIGGANQSAQTGSQTSSTTTTSSSSSQSSSTTTQTGSQSSNPIATTFTVQGQGPGITTLYGNGTVGFASASSKVQYNFQQAGGVSLQGQTTNSPVSFSVGTPATGVSTVYNANTSTNSSSSINGGSFNNTGNFISVNSDQSYTVIENNNGSFTQTTVNTINGGGTTATGTTNGGTTSGGTPASGTTGSGTSNNGSSSNQTIAFNTLESFAYDVDAFSLGSRANRRDVSYKIYQGGSQREVEVERGKRDGDYLLVEYEGRDNRGLALGHRKKEKGKAIAAYREVGPPCRVFPGLTGLRQISVSEASSSSTGSTTQQNSSGSSSTTNQTGGTGLTPTTGK